MGIPRLSALLNSTHALRSILAANSAAVEIPVESRLFNPDVRKRKRGPGPTPSERGPTPAVCTSTKEVSNETSVPGKCHHRSARGDGVGCHAATSVKSSKSNSSERVAVYDSVMTPTQATAFLAEWDKIPLGSTNEAAVRGILQKVLGNKAGSIKKIIIQNDRKPPRIILLGDPNNAPAAIAVSDPGMPADKPKTK